MTQKLKLGMLKLGNVNNFLNECLPKLLENMCENIRGADTYLKRLRAWNISHNYVWSEKASEWVPKHGQICVWKWRLIWEELQPLKEKCSYCQPEFKLIFSIPVCVLIFYCYHSLVKLYLMPKRNNAHNIAWCQSLIKSRWSIQ